MTNYVWQSGIDWNAIQTGGVGYLRGGLTTGLGAGGGCGYFGASSADRLLAGEGD